MSDDLIRRRDAIETAYQLRHKPIDEECVVQYHPPKTEYVNIKDNCLHLWKPINGEYMMPPLIMV